MVDLDDAGDPVGDGLRDRMDPIWLKLTDEERAALDLRDGNPSLFAGSVAVVRTRGDLALRSRVRDLFRSAA